MSELERLAADAPIEADDVRALAGGPPFEIAPGMEVLRVPEGSLYEALVAPARSFSWIGRPELAAVSQQLPFNTCVAHSFARGLETLLRQQGHPPVVLEADEFHQCVLGLNCRAGVTDIKGAVDALRDDGAPRAGNGFKPDDPCPPSLPATSRCAGARMIMDTDTAKLAISRYSPIVALMTAGIDFYDVKGWTAYRDGPGPRDLYHAILLVGFDDDGAYWEVQNSFGTGWGSQGRGRIAYGNAMLFADAAHPGFLLY